MENMICNIHRDTVTIGSVFVWMRRSSLCGQAILERRFMTPAILDSCDNMTLLWCAKAQQPEDSSR